mgnify:CR=1 FL=1
MYKLWYFSPTSRKSRYCMIKKSKVNDQYNYYKPHEIET